MTVLGAISPVGCAQHEAPAASVAPPIGATLPVGFKAEASIIDLMDEFVDPNADELWDSVAVETTRAGTVNHQPRTDKEWKAVRRKALTLVETGNLLATEGRPVARPEQQPAEPGGAGEFAPAQAQEAIDKDHAAFVAFARSFQAASVELLAAIDKRNVDDFMRAGGALDGACEGCHLRFWYPNSRRPPPP